MTEVDKRVSLEESYMYFHDLDPDYPGDQDRIKEMREMGEAALEADVNAAEEFYEYMSGSWFRKNFGMNLS